MEIKNKNRFENKTALKYVFLLCEYWFYGFDFLMLYCGCTALVMSRTIS